MGKLLGAAAVVFGRVSDYDYDEKLTYSDYTDKKGVTTRVYTRKGIVTMKVNLSVTDLETGQIVATKKFEEQKTDTESKKMIIFKTLTKKPSLARPEGKWSIALSR